MQRAIDTVIVGGGQAGLAMSYHLRRRGREHVVLEKKRIAERWRSERWDSLRFQLPNAWLELPGKPYKGGDPDGFTHYPDVIRFIEDYAMEIAAPVSTGVEVTRLTPHESGGYRLETTQGEIRARHVVVATGPFQRPALPGFSGKIPSRIQQVDSSHYRNPAELQPGAVLVAGSGNSGCQIADELVNSGRRVFLSVSRHARAPRRYRGRDVIWWNEQLGRFDVNVDSFPGRRFPPTSIMTGVNGGYDLDPRRLGNAGAILVGRILGCDGGSLALSGDTAELLAAADRTLETFIRDADAFAGHLEEPGLIGPKEDPTPIPMPTASGLRSLDLAGERIGAIVWANGFDFDFSWIKLPVFNDRGAPVQQRGVTAFPGLCFLGLHWMHTFRSAILPFVGRDAEYLAGHIDRLAQTAH